MMTIRRRCAAPFGGCCILSDATGFDRSEPIELPRGVVCLEGGFSVAGYESIGLQYGICLGVLGGTTAGWFWNQPPRLNPIANLFPVMTSCFVALGVIAMHSGFRDLSKDVIEQVRRSSADWQSQKLPEVSRFRQETGTH